MSFYVDIEDLLRFSHKRRVVDPGDRLGRDQVMDVGCHLCQLEPCYVLPPLLLFHFLVHLVIIQISNSLLILLHHIAQILLSGIVIMFVLPFVKASEESLNSLCHCEEVLQLHFSLQSLLLHESVHPCFVHFPALLDVPNCVSKS